jgi:hypothetical protein
MQVRRGIERSIRLLLLAVLGHGALGATLAQAQATIDLHPKVAYMTTSTNFAVKVNGQSADVVGDVNGFDYVHFSKSAGTATIEVTVLPSTSITSYGINPLKANYVGTVSGNKLTFSITAAETQVIVWVNSVGNKLVIDADPLYTPPPSSGTGVYNIASYGADASGTNWSTTAVQNAINAASAWTGGRGIVYVPAGKFKVGNLFLKSDMELFMSEGSAFWFSGVFADYTVNWTSKGNGTRWITTENGADGIKIWGRGTFDGNDYTGIGIQNNILVLNQASNVEVDGVVLRRATKWNTVVGRSNNVLFNRVKWFQRRNGGENDGIDVVESQYVTVKNSIGIGWDDPFSVKSYIDIPEMYDYMGFWGTHEESANITFENLAVWTGCFAFKIGQGVKQPTHDIVFKDSWLLDASHAVGINHDAGVAAAYNITFQNIDVQKIGQSVLGRSWAYFEIHAAQNGPGPIQNVTVKDIKIRSPDGLGTDNSTVYGYDAVNKISGINFENIWVDALGRYAQNRTELKLVGNAFVGNWWVHQTGVRMFWSSSSVGMEQLADWSTGNYKGSCGPGWAMTGLSRDDVNPNPGPHALRCKNYGTAQFTDDWSSPTILSISGTVDNRAGMRFGDWDVGFRKTECGLTDYATGLSQNTSTHAMAHLRCATAATPLSNANCETRSIVSANDQGEATGNWDNGYWKAECANNKVVMGVSADTSGKPRKVLCCDK